MATVNLRVNGSLHAVDSDDVNMPLIYALRNDAGLRNAARKFTATCEWSAQSHVSMGRSCAVSDYKPDGLTV